MQTHAPVVNAFPLPSGAEAEIDALMQAFFSVFTNKNGVKPDLDAIHRMFLPQGLIIKCNGAEREIYTLQEFIEPRRQLLSGGRLIEFQEQEVSARTDIFGSIAQRYSIYKKSGILDGQAFQARGVKAMQLIRMDGWKLVSLAWEDERDGLAIPD
ncbi:hypothetical protein [Collimonas sp.]|jgi:hypothetical protein|uniref:hypothetical protein n=1 Tax=Collimonas sp. TaxID=1963772 RepID=UPI002B528BE4|nr:hypothetical protein [Collimonas sp.]HWW07035.1 hypothetical protein [Collimonas sp.]